MAGDRINNWSTVDSPLAPSGANPDIWQGTFDVSGSTGSTVQYKYVISKTSGPVWEGNVGSGGGTGNRTLVLADTNQVLPVVFFNNVTNSSAVTNAITFQVDMSVQVTLGNFDPASGSVNIAGEFNGWSTAATPLTNRPANPNLWSTTLALSGAVDSAIGYKYVMNGGTWEGNVGPGGSQNRSVTLARTNQVLPVVFFNNVSAVPVPTPLEFQVNLGVQTALGNFDPATDSVEARGSFNNWGAGFVLTNGPADPNVYSGTWVDQTDVPGNAIQYQFVINGSTWETGVGNRNYTITSTNAQTVPLVFFNNVGDLGKLSLQLLTVPHQVTLFWTAGPLVRLQTAVDISGSAWADVPNTQGSNSVTLPLGNGASFFRLTGP